MEDPCSGEANLAVTSSRRASRLRRSGGPARFRAACSRPASLHFLAGLLASGAGAQKAATPVSNTGQQQTTGASRVVETQSFTTGTHGTGYTLSSVWLRPFLDFTGDTATLVTIKTDSGGRPGTLIAALETPGDACVPGNFFAYTTPATRRATAR